MAKAKAKTIKRRSASMGTSKDKGASAASSDDKCAGGVCAPFRKEGLKAQPANGSSHNLVKLDGPGVFLGGRVTKQGGDSDITFVTLEIDGQAIVSMSFAGVANIGLTQSNPFGLMLTSSGSAQTMAFGFPTPLVFRKGLVINVNVQESNVLQIVATAICGKI